jgi:hypothetical protein
MSKSHFVPQSSVHPRCVDGREAVAVVAWNGKNWVVMEREKLAAHDEGPEFLGGSLMFVKALEEILGIERQEAFDLTEEASKENGFGLQIHIDDHHEQFDFSKMSDEEIVTHITTHHGGCGFAKFAWGDEGDDLVGMAKDRRWRIQILKGKHSEKGASINLEERQTFDTATAVKEGNSNFNLDEVEAKKIFDSLEKLINKPGFSKKAVEWSLKTYEDVVIALGGVRTAKEIEINT